MNENGLFPELPSHLKGAKSPILLLEGKEGRIRDINDSLKTHFEILPQELRGRYFDEFFLSETSWSHFYDLTLENGCYRAGPLILKEGGQSVFLNIHPLYIGDDGLFFAAHLNIASYDTGFENGNGKERAIEEGDENAGIFGYLDEIIYRVRYGNDGVPEPIYVSARIREIFGIEAPTFIEKLRNGELEAFLHPEDRVKVRDIHHRVVKEKEPISLTYRVYPKERSEQRWVQEKIHPFFDKNGDHVENMGVLEDVTEQKVAEQRLLQREKHFRNLFENNLAGVFRTSPDRTILSCNQAFVRMLGYQEREQVLGKKVEEIYEGSTDQGKFVRMVEERDGLTGHESKVILRDGRIKYFIENVTPIRDEQGSLLYIDGTMIDITELKEANMALQESEERYRTLLDAAVDAILVWEWESGKIMNLNKSALRLLKREEEEALGERIEKFFPEGKNDPLKNLIQRKEQYNDPSLLNQDSVLIDKEGEQVPVEINARAFEFKGKSYAIGLFRDISEWIESQKALQDSEERFRLLSQATLEGIVMSKDGIVRDLNDQFVKIFGYDDREELIGKDLRELMHPEFLDIGDKKLRGEGSNEITEAKAIRRDGGIIHVLAQGKFIPYHGENVRITVVQDITQRKKVEEELRERERAMHTLLGNLPGIAYRCLNDHDWTMLFISNGCEELLGIGPEQLIRNREYAFGRMILDEDEERVWNEVQNAVSKGERFDIQYRILDINGSVHTVWERGEAVSVDEYTGKTILEGFITDISKRVEYEKKLEKSQARYRELIENSPYGTILYRQNGEVLYINEKGKRITGMEDFEELPSRNILDYLDEEYHELFRERKARVLNGESLPFVEIVGRVPSKDQKIELEVKTELVEYKGENVLHSIFRDITREKQVERQIMRAEVAEEYNKQLEKEIEEHKQTQQKLKDSQEFTRNIIDSSLDMIIASDEDGRITVFNDAAETEFGYSREEVIGSEASALFLDDSERDEVIRSIREEGGFTGEIWNVDQEGKSFLTYLSATSLKDHNGNTIGSMGISRDITEIKEAEEELRKSEEKYRAIYDQAYIGIAQVDLDGNFLNANQQLCSITGYTEEEFRNMNFQDLTVEGDQEKSRTFKEKLRQQKKERVSFEKQYIHKNGSLIDLNLTVALVRDNKQEPAYFVTVFEDITERKKNEKDLKRSLQEKEVLLREVHHRVKNNLQVISSILNLQSNFVEDPNTLQILRESQNRIASMSFIHESLYRTEEFDSIDFAEYVRELSMNLLHSYHQQGKKIELVHDLEEVELDLDKAIPCGLMINELVSNALKYAFPDRDSGKILIGLYQVREEEGSQVRICIEDDGVGLPEGYEVGESDSLGLQLVSSLLAQIGGQISLKRDNGTSYLITFGVY